MKKIEEYRQKLRELADWDAYLLAESGLPGPRGNLELAQAVADLGSVEQFERYAALDAKLAPTGGREEFLAFCGVLGYGRLLAEGNRSRLNALRGFASDPRWRLREAVAMALQRWGDADLDALLGEMPSWSQGNAWEQRAAAAGLCEPRLLRQPESARAVLGILDEITESICAATNRKDAGFQTLRQGMGYCWSVAVAALPEAGLPLMEKWLRVDDPDVRWMMRENLKKNRLVRIDRAWVEAWQKTF